MSVQEPYSENQVRQDINYLYEKRNSYRWISCLYDSGITYGDLQRIHVHGVFPRDRGKRKALGIKPRQRVAISKDNMKSAARTITRNLEPEQVRELVEMLRGD